MSTNNNTTFSRRLVGPLVLGITIIIFAVGGYLLLHFGRGHLAEVETSTRPETKTAEQHGGNGQSKVGLVELVSRTNNAIRVASPKAMQTLGVRIGSVHGVAPPESLRLPGALSLDPNRIVRVHSRFLGEVLRLGMLEDGSRPLRYGDTVQKGQVLAVIWSKEIGEKKSELIDAISKLDSDAALLTRLETVEKGIVTARAMFEAKRAVEADLIAVARAERTLRSWRIGEDEIAAVRNEVKAIQQRSSVTDRGAEQSWAETTIRAAIDGVIIEKSVNAGDIVDQDGDLFKIADLSRLQVVASIYEEDMALLRDVPADKRHWSIDLKADPLDEPVDGLFEMIGNVIDPAQRTGVLMGWIENRERRFSIGQFITATIDLPVDAGLVGLPESALIEEGDSSTAFFELDADRLEYVRRKVTVAKRCRNMVLVRAEGITPNDRVLTSGVLQLGAELTNLQRLASTR